MYQYYFVPVLGDINKYHTLTFMLRNDFTVNLGSTIFTDMFVRLGSIIDYRGNPCLILGRYNMRNGRLVWWKPFRRFGMREVYKGVDGRFYDVIVS